MDNNIIQKLSMCSNMVGKASILEDWSENKGSVRRKSK